MQSSSGDIVSETKQRPESDAAHIVARTPGVTLNVCLSGYGQAARPISTG